jgi:hypothetical protein
MSDMEEVLFVQRREKREVRGKGKNSKYGRWIGFKSEDRLHG